MVAEGEPPPYSAPPPPWARLRRLLVAMRLIGLARLVDRTAKRLYFGVTNQVERTTRLPVAGRVLYPLSRRFRREDDFHVGEEELWRIVATLDETGLEYWVVGGWGLDSLVGCETRRHGDVDVLLADFAGGLSLVAQALGTLGFRREQPLGGTPWFPDAEVFEDRSRHRIEVLSLGAAACDEAVVRGLIEPSERDRMLPTRGRVERPTQFTAIGSIDGQAVRTISEEWQRLFHSGYDGRPEEAHAESLFDLLRRRRESQTAPGAPVIAVASGEREPTSLLLVPVFSFPTALWKLCRLYRNDLNMVPPHVTVAFPFLPLREVTSGVVGQLQRFFGGTEAFDFALTDIRWFDSEVVYLAPNPAAPFIDLTTRLQEIFPDFKPYGGEFDSVVPHVTLSRHGNAGDRRIVARFAPRYIPLEAEATHCWLMADHRGIDQWSIVDVFDFARTGP